MTVSNEAIYRRMIEEGFNQGNLAVVDELVAPGAIEHQRGSGDGIEGTKKVIIYLRSRSRPTIEVSSLMLFDEAPAPVASRRPSGTQPRLQPN